MWHRDTKWGNGVGKLAPTDLLHAGCQKTSITKKKKRRRKKENKKTLSVKRNKVKGNKTRSACNRRCSKYYTSVRSPRQKTKHYQTKKCPAKEDVIDKIIQGVLFFLSFGAWKHFILPNFDGGGGILFSFLEETHKQKNSGAKSSYRDNMDPFLDAFQTHVSAN